MLKDIVIPKRKIELDSGSFEVRGLSLYDLGELVDRYEREINDLFRGRRTLQELINELPDLAAEMVARAADEPDQIEQVKQLPLGSQLSALESLWDLTIPDEKALGNVLARIKFVIERYGGPEMAHHLPDTSEPEAPNDPTTGSES